MEKMISIKRMIAGGRLGYCVQHRFCTFIFGVARPKVNGRYFI